MGGVCGQGGVGVAFCLALAPNAALVFAEPSRRMPICPTLFLSHAFADYCGDKAWGDPNPIDYCIPTDNNCVQPWVGVLPKCTGPVTAFGGGAGTM